MLKLKLSLYVVLCAFLSSSAYGQEAKGTIPGPVGAILDAVPTPPPAPAQPALTQPAHAEDDKQIIPGTDAAPAVVTPVAPTETPAKPEIPAKSPIQTGSFKSFKESDVSKFVKNFKIKLTTDENGGGHLSFTGLVDPRCAKHLRIQMSSPVEGDDVPTWALSFEKADLIDTNSGNKVVSSIDNPAADDKDACTPEMTRSCTRETCVNVTEVRGIRGIEDTTLDQDGKITSRYDDFNFPEGDPRAITYSEIPSSHGGPFAYVTKETQDRIDAENEAKAHRQLLVSVCQGASLGNRDKIEELCDMLGPDCDKHSELLEAFRKIADENEYQEFETRLAEATTLKDLIKLKADAEEYAKLHKRDKEIKKGIAKLMIGMMARANELENTDESISENMFTGQKLDFSEKAVRSAMKLDPQNKNYTRSHRMVVLTAGKWSAKTGEDAFYNKIVKNQIKHEAAQVIKLRRSKDPEDKKVYNEYAKVMQPRYVPQRVSYYSPWYGPMEGYMYKPGNELDQTFFQTSEDKRRLMREEAYRAQLEEQSSLMGSADYYSGWSDSSSDSWVVSGSSGTYPGHGLLY